MSRILHFYIQGGAEDVIFGFPSDMIYKLTVDFFPAPAMFESSSGAGI